MTRAEYAREWRKQHPGYDKRYQKRRTELRHQNPETHRLRNQNWYHHNFLKHLLIGAKNRAAHRGLLFSLALSDVAIPQHCPILGLRLVVHIGGGRGSRRDDSPSLDRVDNAKGYIPGNVRVISWRANRLKSDGTAEEYQKIADWMQKKAL